jgi:LPS-assembly lipoprotein
MSINLVRMRFLVLLAAVLLSACGFHLRGSGATAALPFKLLYVTPGDSPLGVELKRYIVSSGSAITTDPNAAQVIIDVLSDVREKTILSLNSLGRVREYTLSYRVSFRVRDSKQNELLAPSEITLRRTLSFNEAQALAKEAEEATLYRDLQSDMVQQLLRRIAAIKPAV